MEALSSAGFDVAQIRAEFPGLAQAVRGHPLVYFDNAATTQRPRSVIEATEAFYLHDNANVHRGVHLLSQRATDHFEAARRKLQRFIGAPSEHDVVFTKGCTEAINLVAGSWGRANLGPGDEVLVSTMEHHSNIVPWQLIAEEKGARVRPIPIDDAGEIDLEAFRSMLSPRVKLVGVVYVSNSLGTVNPVESMTRDAHRVGARILVDGAQALAHMPVDVEALDVDFFAMTAHKMYGPTGIGALYAKRELLEAMPPYQSGGGMIRTVSFEGSTFAAPPEKFEPGTPNIAGVIGWGAAIDFMNDLDREAVAAHEHRLIRHAISRLEEIEGLRIIGNARDRSSVVSFVIDGVHPHDIGTIIDGEGIAIRTGHHCCMPLMQRMGVPATARASFALYNTEPEIERLGQAIVKAKEMLA